MDRFLATLKRTLKDIRDEHGIPANRGRGRRRKRGGRRGQNAQQQQQQQQSSSSAHQQQQSQSSSSAQQQPPVPSSPIGSNAPSGDRPQRMSQQQNVEEVCSKNCEIYGQNYEPEISILQIDIMRQFSRIFT